MSFDGLSIGAVTKEISENLIGAKIQRVYQPYKDEVVLYFSDRRKIGLLLCANASFPRINLTKASYDNPEYPPAFCMLLRKYLIGGIIKDVRQCNFDRIVNIFIESLDGANNLIKLCLTVEIMGKHSNIILTEENSSTVLDAIKHISSQKSSVRAVMPNEKYILPPNSKSNPFDYDISTALGILSFNSGKTIEAALMDVFSGISKPLAMSFAKSKALEGKDVAEISVDELTSICCNLPEYLSKKGSERKNYIYFDNGGKYKDFSHGEYEIYASLQRAGYASISDAIEDFYKEKTRSAGVKEKYEYVIKHLETLLAKENRKLALRKKEREEALDSEKYSVKGNLLLSNIHLLKKGMDKIEVDNFYASGEKMTVPLRIDYTPSQNAQMYFKKYTKAKSAAEHLETLIEKSENDVYEISSLLYFLSEASNVSEAQAVISQAEKEGYVKSSKTKKRPYAAEPTFRKFFTSDGYSVYAGKNSLQNASLTFKTASKEDIWLHAKDVAASHVILKTRNGVYSQEALQEAAVIAAYYSRSKSSDNVQVDYTFVKNVKKMSGKAPGRVTYTHYQSLYVTPSEQTVRELSVKEESK